MFAAVSVAVFGLSAYGKLLCAAGIIILSAIALIISAIPNSGRTGRYIKKRRALTVGIALSAILAIAVSYLYMNVWYASVRERDGEESTVRGYVTERIYETSFSGGYRVTLTMIDGERCRLGAILETEFAAGLSVGKEISANVEFSVLGSDGAFDEEAYYLPRGAVIKAVAADGAELTVEGEHESFGIGIAKLRGRISAALKVSLGRDGRGIAEAVFIGDRASLDDEMYRDFKYIGALHLLAISGMHLAVVIGMLDKMLQRVGLGRKLRHVTLMFSTVVYVALSGFSSSVVRAGVMMIIYYASFFVLREADSVTSLFVAAAGIMLFSPASAADTGLLLSVTAMLGCLFADRLFITDKIKGALSEFARRGVTGRFVSSIVRWTCKSLLISLSTLLFTLPVMWLKFGRLSLLSPVSTLALMLPIKWILYLCPVIAVIPQAGALTRFLTAPCIALCKYISWASSALARIDGATLSLSGRFRFAAVACVLITALLMAALMLKKRGALRSIAAASVLFAVTAILSSVYFAAYSTDVVEYINYKKNDGFVVSDGMRTLICDISDGSWTPSAMAADKADGSGRIDVFLLTHLHRRHVNTFERLCRREYVREVWLPIPDNEEEDAVFVSMCETAEMFGVRVVSYERGERVMFGSVKITTIPHSGLKRSTHPVIAIEIATESERCVYIGASVHESGAYEFALDMCRGADEVIFGIHGPVYKSAAEYYLDGDARIVYANEEVEAFFENNP